MFPFYLIFSYRTLLGIIAIPCCIAHLSTTWYADFLYLCPIYWISFEFSIFSYYYAIDKLMYEEAPKVE